ncbi:putative ubiquitin-conjugating enzyme E2 [Heracleum sosnowskyi]|uniref:Ubiquitin-conjugating enzyme E2 n=1 Tax=Heracleum sosnowskyi TaxID=360622 RepID=A0AAD8HXS0_9APIA|nr:putative ubiquitin-conjugating enzyme E2 [Heracleum sosnowskyi]
MASSLKEYLKKYQSSDDVEKKKKKKKKNQKKPDVSGVLVVDEDPVWQKPVVPEEENDDDSADEEKPQVDEDIEVKRMKRLEQLKARRPYGLISDDGSGWVSVNNAPQKLIDSNSDMSPPRKRRSRNDTPSPEPELRPDAEIVDQSPPRQRRRRYHSPSDSIDEKVDLSPPRKRRASLNNPSPERVRITSKSGHADLDMSPPRRGRRDSPGRVDSRLSPGEDLSPPRKSRSDNPQSQVSDLSPPRKSRRDLSPPRKHLKESTSRAEQRKTGLVSGKDVTEEVLKAKKEEFLRFKAKDPSITGQGAEPIYRDKKTGQRLTKDEFLKSQKKDEKPKEVKLEWGKGLAQKREAEARQEELELEKAKPFARTRDDPDLDRMMKDRLRWGDPMAHLVKKKHDELVLPDMGDDEKMKASGFIVPQEIPSHSWLKRGLEAAPNRYGIKPGRHWDGVDRSTGFEKAMFKRMNEKQATEKEAYLWSVADM